MTRIIAPFGPPINERPPVPTAEERETEHALRAKAKKERKFVAFQTERLTSKLAQAEKVTASITEMAAEINMLPSALKGIATPLVKETPARIASAKATPTKSTSTKGATRKRK